MINIKYKKHDIHLGLKCNRGKCVFSIEKNERKIIKLTLYQQKYASLYLMLIFFLLLYNCKL